MSGNSACESLAVCLPVAVHLRVCEPGVWVDVQAVSVSGTDAEAISGGWAAAAVEDADVSGVEGIVCHAAQERALETVTAVTANHDDVRWPLFGGL